MSEVVQQFDEDLSQGLGALAANDVIAAVTKTDGSRTQGFRLSKVRICGRFSAKTATEGPIAWGISCNGGGTDVENAIEADPQNSSDDDVRGSGLYIKPLGIIGVEETQGSLHEGMPHLDVKVNWSVPEGENFSLWFYNMGSGALTTGTLIHAFIEKFGVWLRD